MKKRLKRVILLLISVVTVFVSVPFAHANAATLSSQFVGYNIISGYVVNGVYLRGAPYDSTSACPIYFYKINGNNIYIAPGNTIYVIEREENYFYIAYEYNGTYYCGYVPIGDISCSNYSWSNHDIMWPGLYDGIPENGSRIQNVCYGPGDASYFTRWYSVNVDYITSATLLRKTNRYAFIQYMIDDGGVFKYVRGWVWGNYINPWPNIEPEYDEDKKEYIGKPSFFYFHNQTKSYDDSKKDLQDSIVYIVNGCTNKALTVPAMDDGTILTTETFNGGIQQEFCLVKSGHYPYSFRLYSLYAKKFVDIDHDTADGGFARVRSASGGIGSEITTTPWLWSNGRDTNAIVGVRRSGLYNALTVDSAGRVIMHKREAIDTYNWNIREKYWDGTLSRAIIKNDYGDTTVKYSISGNINTNTKVKPNMVRRAAEYWNMCAQANLESMLSNVEFNLTEYDYDGSSIIVQYVNQKDVDQSIDPRACAYFIAEDVNGNSIISDFGSAVYYRDWKRITLNIIREKTANLTDDEIVKMLAHEFGHCLKMPHTAVNQIIVSSLNTKGFDAQPDFNYIPSATSGNSIAEYDRVRLGKKQY